MHRGPKIVIAVIAAFAFGALAGVQTIGGLLLSAAVGYAVWYLLGLIPQSRA